MVMEIEIEIEIGIGIGIGIAQNAGLRPGTCCGQRAPRPPSLEGGLCVLVGVDTCAYVRISYAYVYMYLNTYTYIEFMF